MNNRIRLYLSILTITIFFALQPVAYAASPSPFKYDWQGIPSDFDYFALEPLTDTFVVNTTYDNDDDGTCDETHCSLREAINAANTNPAPDTIEFKIPGDPPFTIQLQSALPAIADPVTIDATTQPGFEGSPIIVLDGSDAGAVDGLVITTQDSMIRGFVINRFEGNGILIDGFGATGNSVQGNFIGTDVTGTIDLGNLRGVFIVGGAGNLIGGIEPGAGNILSGNSIAGVNITGGTGNLVQGNFIGADVNGTASVGSSGLGVVVDGGATDTEIGGTAEGSGNLISGNMETGVQISGLGTNGNRVQGNYIGIDLTGTQPLGNFAPGVGIGDQASENQIVGNLISGNKGDGVTIVDDGTTGNVIQGNYIGTDVTGSTTTGSAGLDPEKITVMIDEEATCPTYGPETDFDGFVSESDDPMAPWSGTPVHFKGTEEGCADREELGAASLIYRYKLEFAEVTQLTSIAVSGAAFNGPDSVLRVLDENRNVLGSTETFGGNSFQIHFVTLQSAVGTVFFIEEYDTSTTWRFRQSMVVTGSLPLGNLGNGVLLAGGASGNMVGGADSTTRNIISGNLANGVAVFSPGTTDNLVQGNYIGTDLTGAQPLGNFAPGVGIGDQASNNLVVGNLISGNRSDGVAIFDPETNGNRVQGNLIGTDASGTAALPNTSVGVWIGNGASDTLIGGTGEGAGNLISGNDGDGVSINDSETTGTFIQGNLIGTDVTGMLALGNFRGVFVAGGAVDNLIGGTQPNAGNLISGNWAAGVRLTDVGTTGNKVEGNLIGTDLTGRSPLGNGYVGVRVSDGATNNQIGGTEESARNVISGNKDSGVLIDGEGTTGNVVQGNYIGTDLTGGSTAGPVVGDYSVMIDEEATCPTYGPETDFDGFVSESDDPMAPWSGTSVHFKGTDECTDGEELGAASLIYRYKLEFAEVTQLTSIAVSGAAFNGPDSVLRVLDENMNVLGITETFGGNSFQIHFVTLQSAVGTVFFIEEYDTSTTWRFRQRILVNASALGNYWDGVAFYSGASDNLISENLISGNMGCGVRIADSGTIRNTLQGNLIGTDSSGSTALPNYFSGVEIGDAAETLIEGNVISGNGGSGISIYGSDSAENAIRSNLIGTNSEGSAPLPNNDGIWVGGDAKNNTIGGTATKERNLVSGNKAFGISLNDTASANLIIGNFIGTDGTGTLPLGNNWGGVFLGSGSNNNTLGGWQAGAGNLVSGNGGDGVIIADPGTTANTLQGNLIGTDASGTAALPNSGVGVWIGAGGTNSLIGGTEEGAGNLISGNNGDGVSINDSETTGNVVQGNHIGTDLAGTAPLPNMSNGIVLVKGTHDNLIGGTSPGVRNLISGNAGSGVVIVDPGTSGNIVQGNYIGTDVTGTVALGNPALGVLIAGGATDNLIGGTEANADNLISGNGWGVLIYGDGATGNLVQGNYLGTDASGTAALPNNGVGVWIGGGASKTLIGGSDEGAGNTIAFNSGAGIALGPVAGLGNSLLSNSVFSNGGLGIDLSNDGVTLNDVRDQDAGPNNLQNFPIINAITRKSTSVVIHGLLASTPSTTFRLEFFSNDECDPSGFGEGRVFLGFAFVTTNRAGNTSFNITLPVSLPQGAFVTATATDPFGNTSEFSRCFGPIRQWVAAFIYDLPSGFRAEGEHPYHFEFEWTSPEPGAFSGQGGELFVSDESQLYDGYVLLRGPEEIHRVVYPGGPTCEAVEAVHPDQPTRFLIGWLPDDMNMTYPEAKAHFESITARVVWDESNSADLLRHEIRPFSYEDIDKWFDYVCTYGVRD